MKTCKNFWIWDSRNLWIWEIPGSWQKNSKMFKMSKNVEKCRKMNENLRMWHPKCSNRRRLRPKMDDFWWILRALYEDMQKFPIWNHPLCTSLRVLVWTDPRDIVRLQKTLTTDFRGQRRARHERQTRQIGMAVSPRVLPEGLIVWETQTFASIEMELPNGDYNNFEN